MENKNDNIKVSIIVPIYNIPETILRKCIESAIGQTMRDIEVILVDDGSTDHSGVICDEYAQIDPRVKVIHKKNGGLSAARNTGYEEAKGTWITFVDSDDWIESCMCEDVYRLGEENNSEVVIFGTVQEFGHYRNEFKYHYADGSVFEGEQCKELQAEILNYTGNIATAWAKLFRKSFLDRYTLKHNEELRQGSEGIEYNIRVFERVNRAFFTDNVYYHYVYNPNSISAKHDEKNHYFVIKCFEEIGRQIQQSQSREKLEAMFNNRFSYVIVAAAISGFFSPMNKQSYSEQKRSFKNYLDQDLVNKTMKSISTSELDFQRRIILTLIKLHQFGIIKILARIRFWQKHS